MLNTWSMFSHSNEAFFDGWYEGGGMSTEGGRAGKEWVRQGLWKQMVHWHG